LIVFLLSGLFSVSQIEVRNGTATPRVFVAIHAGICRKLGARWPHEWPASKTTVSAATKT